MVAQWRTHLHRIAHLVHSTNNRALCFLAGWVVGWVGTKYSHPKQSVPVHSRSRSQSDGAVQCSGMLNPQMGRLPGYSLGRVALPCLEQPWYGARQCGNSEGKRNNNSSSNTVPTTLSCRPAACPWCRARALTRATASVRGGGEGEGRQGGVLCGF